MSLRTRSRLERALYRTMFLGAGVFIASVVAFMVGIFRSAGSASRTPSFTPLGVAAVAFGLTFFAVVILGWRLKVVQARRDEHVVELFGRIRQGHPLRERVFVYLRPFTNERRRTTTEPMVIDAFDPLGTLVAVDEPSFRPGIGRLALGDDEWQQAVLDMCAAATAIIIEPAPSEGTFWELVQLQRRGWLGRTLIVMPPDHPEPLRSILRTLGRLAAPAPASGGATEFADFDRPAWWRRAQARAGQIGIELPDFREEGGVYHLAHGEPKRVLPFVVGRLGPGVAPDASSRVEPVLARLDGGQTGA